MPLSLKTFLRDALIGAFLILVFLYLGPLAILASAPPIAIMLILAVALTLICALLTANPKLAYLFGAIAIALILLALWPGTQFTLPWIGLPF